jgi:hypothetical protein
MTFLHWLIEVENPVKLYGFWPVLIWATWCVITLGGFALLETIGLKRTHEAIPLTWFIRCGPRLAGFVFFGWAIWHFLFVTTKP